MNHQNRQQTFLRLLTRIFRQIFDSASILCPKIQWLLLPIDKKESCEARVHRKAEIWI